MTTTPTLPTPTHQTSEPRARPRPRSVVADLATRASRHRGATLVVLAAVVASGVWAFLVGLDRQGFPPIDTPVAVVQGSYLEVTPGGPAPLPAETVDAEVVVPLTDAFVAVPGVAATSSEAFPGGFAVVVEFEDGIPSDEGAARLEAVDVVLPDGAVVEVVPVEAASFVGRYDLLVSVVARDAGVTPEALESRAARVAAALAADPDVAVAEVRDLLSEVADPATGATATTRTRFTRVVLGPGEGFRPAVTIGVEQAATSTLDVLGFSDRVDELLAAASATDVDVAITADLATTVRLQLGSLGDNLRTGLLAVALVSLLLIGWRVSVLTAGFVGVVLLLALSGLWAVGYTLNTITLFGLILTLGLLVDDAIVVSESIDAERDDPDPSEDDPSLGVIRSALTRVGSASWSGTLTTVVVFSPLLFVGGILGEFIRPIPATVIITLLASFLASVVFIPAVARGFLLGGTHRPNPVVRGLRRVAAAAGRLAAYPSGNGARGVVVGVLLASLSLAAVGVGGSLASGLGFSIFPSGKDAVTLVLSGEFPPGTSIEDAQRIADEVDAVVVDVLGDDLVGAQYTRGNERLVEVTLDLTPIDARGTTAPAFVAALQPRLDAVDGARVTVRQQENGPPSVDFPFAVQIAVDGDSADAGRALASEVRSFLAGRTLTAGGVEVTITEAVVSTDGVVARADGQRYVEVRAAYDDTSSVSALTQDTRALVQDAFGDTLADRGLATDALGFDFGLESDNQEDFATLGVVGQLALLLMLLLLALQFRSVAQPLLIVLAIPFSFLGVFTLLDATDNPLSFLVAVGFIALIGVAVNNTILLVEAANRARSAGATAAEAIRDAVTRRFRPLVATTVTTVVGLLPLSLADPFWESLGFTLIGGLVSSTVLVLLSFPAYYLALEAVRTPLRNAVRRRSGRPELA